MAKYTIEGHYHHNNPKNPWFWNIEAEDEAEALIKAFVIAIESEYGLVVNPDDLKDIANQKELVIECEDECDSDPEYTTKVSIWNEPENTGCGIGDSPNDTDKYTNVWVTVRPQDGTKKSLANAIRGHMNRLEELKVRDLKEILDLLEG